MKSLILNLARSIGFWRNLKTRSPLLSANSATTRIRANRHWQTKFWQKFAWLKTSTKTDWKVWKMTSERSAILSISTRWPKWPKCSMPAQCKLKRPPKYCLNCLCSSPRLWVCAKRGFRSTKTRRAGSIAARITHRRMIACKLCARSTCKSTWFDLSEPAAFKFN